MLCCQECTLETDATLTTVLFIDQMSAQRQQIMTQYAHKHMKNIRNKNNIKQHVGGKEDNIHIEQLSEEDKKSWDKQNQKGENVREILKTKRKDCNPLELGSSSIQNRKTQECNTGRFPNSSMSRASSSRDTRKQLTSKTTSFGSLGSRSSLTQHLLSRAELTGLSQQLELLREEELQLMRQKVQREHLYAKQLSKISGIKNELYGKSKERASDLLQLRQLLAKTKAVRSNRD